MVLTKKSAQFEPIMRKGVEISSLSMQSRGDCPLPEPSGRESPLQSIVYKHYWTIRAGEVNAVNLVILNHLCPLAPAIVQSRPSLLESSKRRRRVFESLKF
jgi:hypothetical protein